MVKSLEIALSSPEIAGTVKDFVNYTFDMIAGGKPHVQAAVFTFGREDLIPNMFLAIVSDLNTKFPDQVSQFKYYLDRHIEVDGDHHSHLALEMTAELCRNDDEKWQEVTDAAIIALEKRIGLWDGVYSEIVSTRVLESH